jgi:CubicO group peptidase (beta-lactamase class C family)
MSKLRFYNKSWTTVIGLTTFFLVIPGFTNPTFAGYPAAGPTDPAELEAFMDGVIEAQLEAYHLAGATVAVVKDGAVFFAKGYGYADIKERKRVNAGKTLFRIASISKLFVWTAIMQLVEQGVLDLNADINTYLTRFKIPPTFAEPITLNHLMAHTAGFEDYVIGLFSKDRDQLLPLGDIIAQHLPARVRPPGEVASYSNHGTAIAAYIVEQVSGKCWDDYVEKNILMPLAMTHTTFRQPVPDLLSTELSKGYSYKHGEFHAEAFVYVPMAPVAAASTTATDIARFMIAHLNLGRFGNSRILDAGTAQRMHGALFRPAPDVNPMAHGFFDISRNGKRVIGHDGNILYFHSKMALLPDQKVGLFVSYNTQGGEKAAMKTYELFMDRYYPPENMQAEIFAKNSNNQLERFTGSYFSNRRVHQGLAKLGALLGTIKVKLTDEGVLKTTGQETTRWIQIGPETFREEHGNRILVFREDENGKITHMFRQDLPHIAFERIHAVDSPKMHVGLAGSATLLFFATILAWPFAAFIRWRHDVQLDPRTRIPRFAYLITWIASLLFIVLVAFLAVVLSNPNSILFGIPVWLKPALVLPILSVPLIIGTMIYTVAIWKSGKGSIWGRIYYTVVMLALVVTLWQLNHWNLLGFHY